MYFRMGSDGGINAMKGPPRSFVTVCRMTLAVAAITAWLGCRDPRPVVVVIGDMNSAAGSFGHHFADGVRVALEPFPVRVVSLDDRDSPSAARVKAASLVQDQRVVLVVGHSASATTIAAAGIYSQSGIPLIAPVATTDDLFPHGVPKDAVVFRLPPPNRVQALALVRHARERGIDRIVVVHVADGAYSDDMAANIRRVWIDPPALREVKVDPLEIGSDTSRYERELSRAIASAFNEMPPLRGRRAVAIATYYREAAIAIRAARLAGTLLGTEIEVVSTDGGLHPRVAEHAGEALRGVHFIFVGPSWQEFDPRGIIFQAYRQLHTNPRFPKDHPQREDQPRTWNRMWPSFMEYGYVAGVLAGRAIRVADSVSGQVTKNTVLLALESGGIQVGVGPWAVFEFQQPVHDGVWDPKHYFVSVFNVASVALNSDLDATWLRRSAVYTEADLEPRQ